MNGQSEMRNCQAAAVLHANGVRACLPNEIDDIGGWEYVRYTLRYMRGDRDFAEIVVRLARFDDLVVGDSDGIKSLAPQPCQCS